MKHRESAFHQWKMFFFGCSLLAAAEGLPAIAGPALQAIPAGWSVQVDPSFSYYQDRSPESIASELKINGCGWVRYIVTRDSTARAPFVEACRKAGLAVSYTTLGNGVYNSGDLPAGWESWKMRLKDSPKVSHDGFTYLCMNHPDYQRWKKDRIMATLKRISFDGFEMMEPFWPAYDGPASASYGCLCDHCRAAFVRADPGAEDIPHFTDAKHPLYYRTNRGLYEKWIEFRARSVASFLDDIVNGPRGVRTNFPALKVSVWGIADAIPNAVATLKEWEGIDGALIVSTVRPDLFVIQTDWPDWIKPGLAPEYVLKYKPFADAIRATGSTVPVQVQTDIGSKENCRRGSDWLRKCEAAAQSAGIMGIVPYEYHLGLDIYEAPPKPMQAAGAGNIITIIFNKRLSATQAAQLRNYTVAPGGMLSVKADGNLVKLEVTGRPTHVTARHLADDPARRFFKNHPAMTMPAPVTLPVHWQ